MYTDKWIQITPEKNQKIKISPGGSFGASEEQARVWTRERGASEGESENLSSDQVSPPPIYIHSMVNRLHRSPPPAKHH